MTTDIPALIERLESPSLDRTGILYEQELRWAMHEAAVALRMLTEWQSISEVQNVTGDQCIVLYTEKGHADNLCPLTISNPSWARINAERQGYTHFKIVGEPLPTGRG